MARVCRGSVLAAVIGALLLFSVPTSVRAQPYAPALPPGVLSVSISTGPGGEQASSLDLNRTPVVNSTTPVFSGRLTPGTTQAEFAVFSTPVRWTGPVDPVTGAFETVVPVQLEPGVHSFYINSALVGRFIVPENAGPTVPGVPPAAVPGATTGTAASQPTAAASAPGPTPRLPRTGASNAGVGSTSGALKVAVPLVLLALALMIPLGLAARYTRGRS